MTEKYIMFYRVAQAVSRKYHDVPYAIPNIHAAIRVGGEIMKQKPKSKKAAIKLIEWIIDNPEDKHPLLVAAYERTCREIIEDIKNV